MSDNKVFIRGTWITLTPEQMKIIEKERNKKKAASNSFKKMLINHGFKKLDTTGWLDPKQECYEHVYYNWFAQIFTHNSLWVECWLVGSGLRNSGFPGGWMYGSTEELNVAIEVAFRKLSDEHED